MNKDDRILKPEDYEEPRCLLNMEPWGQAETLSPIPQQRIIEKMDEYMSHRDYDGAERHLLYWLEEARAGHDLKGQLMIRNELTGHYRKTGEKENSLRSGEEALSLLDALDMGDSISAGTTYVNYATASHAFGEYGRAMELFRKARTIYESTEMTRPELLGGLYNNMALTCVAAGRFSEADALYRKALAVMDQVPGGVLEQAITWLNMANALEEEKGLLEAEDQINEYLDRALALLNTPSVPRDGYYAFVCEKCAPTFRYYGYFLDGEDLENRAKKIYALNH